ncbi:hypothetical protein STAS_35564 [Striga asiatica]|uniref:Uncharacterized protein n=1 Tax=Striga asiatica TaxID=4170 RepID=A0A5A7RKQ1_STRAF|nr:hypothetical protein STAS_35564 [Striga asiatica]
MISTPLIRSKILSQSSSLPSRSHPLIPLFDEHLHVLKSEHDSTSLRSITQKLHDLEKLHNHVHDLLLLPHTRQVFARERNEKWVDEILEGYLRLVDFCSVAKDFLSHSKEQISNFLFILRRKKLDSEYDFSEFLSSRKSIKKRIRKSLRSYIIGSFKNKQSFSTLLDKDDQETISIISMLKETEYLTVDLFEELLSSVAGVRPSGRWALVASWLIKSRKKSGGRSKSASLEFGDLDASLSKFVSKCEMGSKIEDLKQQLREMELVIAVVEERLECMFKRLIKSRVSLLNMQSQYTSNHTRSLSLPSKSDPVFSQFEETLSNVRNSESSCSSLLSMNNSLVGLKHLYSKIDDLLQSPHVQQLISRESHMKFADRVLDGHIVLLDACTTAKDHVSLAKQSVQQLLSAVRRKDADSVHFYLNSRRKSKKMIRKSLKQSRIFVSREKDGETMNDLAYMLKEAELTGVKMLESLLSYLMGTNNKVQTRWALVSKLMSTKKNESCQNEFEKIDVFLQSSSLGDLRVDEEIIIMSELKRTDSSIQNLEEELDCLFRQLIKTRQITMKSIIISQTRSSSMPSRPYPLLPEFEHHLQALKSDNFPTSSSSLSSISEKMNNLEQIHDFIDNLLILPHTHQIFTRERHEKWVEQIMDGYLGLVDACATAKDFIFQSKDYISNLLSVLRRKRGSVDLSEFISSRKTIKKQIQKSLRNIGRYKKNSPVLKTGDKDQETIAIISMLKEVESITLELIEALLSSISGSKDSKWSLVSKLMGSRKVSCHEHKSSMLGFEDLDASLSKFVSKCETGSKIEELKQQLREMELVIRVIEERLERLFKRLIKSRVSLLNMQSHMPSRPYYPIIPEFKLHLQKMKSDHFPTSSSSSLSSIAEKMNNLEQIHDFIDNLLILPHTHQIFTRERHEKWVEQILDGYLGLVDACATAKDFITQSKEHISNLLSVLRRKRGSEDLSEFISSRKMIKKQIQKSLRKIGSYKKNSSGLKTGEKDQETIAIIGMLKEAESVTLELIEALLSSISRSKDGSKLSKWSLVSNIMGSRKVSCHEHEHKSSMLEFGDLDALSSKFVSKCETGSKIEDLQRQLRKMELVITVIEERLECLFKRLIKSRVSLLNMQSQLTIRLCRQFTPFATYLSSFFPKKPGKIVRRNLGGISRASEHLCHDERFHRAFKRKHSKHSFHPPTKTSPGRTFRAHLLMKNRKKEYKKVVEKYSCFEEKILGNYDKETIAIVRMLKEVKLMKIDLMEDLSLRSLEAKELVFLSHEKSFVPTSQKCTELFGFGDLDSALRKFVHPRTSKSCETGLRVDEHQMQSRDINLRDIDAIIRVVEERLECLFKRLIQSRVCLLNMNSHFTMKSIILSHMRSSSMPSRPYYPLIPEFKLHLQKIKSDNFPTSSSSSLSSIAEKMKDLEQIHDLIDNLLILPHTHQIFTRESHEKWVEQILDGYLGLVDACATAKDFISQSKDYISNLLSVLRRKRGSENLSEFISSRKTIKKQIQKSLRKLGSYKNSPSVLETGDKDQETIAIIGMLKEAESITLELIETLLSSISRSKDGSRLSNWSLVSKLVGSRKVSCHEHKSSMLGFEDLDASLSKIFSKCETGSKIEELKQQLREMDLVIAVIEERFESLFKRLIKSRVSLLNMQSQL